MRPLRIFFFFSLIAILLAAGSFYLPALLRYDLRSYIQPEKTIGETEEANPQHNIIAPSFPADTTFEETCSDTLKKVALSDSLSLYRSGQHDSASDTLQSDTLSIIEARPPGLNELLPVYGDSGLIRVMIFGDSQLEGDRFTSRIRSHLQGIYGGSGPGLLQPVMPVMYTRTVELRSSSNWSRYNYLSYRDGTISHRSIGPFMSFCRFFPDDSISAERINASVRITPSVLVTGNASRYDRLRLFYGRLPGECVLTVSTGNIILGTDTLREGEGPYEYACSVNGVSDLRLSFSGFASPDVYAFSIEGDSGVVVDNIPHRGSAGLEFTMADKNSLGTLLQKLDPHLIILQYGLNIVRNVRNDYTYYQRGLERQIKLLQELAPGTNLLLMSLTDMATDESGSFISFENIQFIRDAQQRAAESSGITFWDTYLAMGGENSVVKWVGADPPLAQKDYTHLTYAGSDSIASMLLLEMLLREVTENFLPIVNDSVIASDTSYVDAGAGAAVQMQAEVIPSVPDKWYDNRVIKILSYQPGTPFIFTNIAFWLFFLVLMAGYSIVYKNRFIRNFYLFLFSLFFYYKSGGFFLVLLILSTLTDYTAGWLIYRSKANYARRVWLLLSLLVNLGMLGYFKYYGFIIETINNLAGTSIAATDILAIMSNDLLGTNFNISSVILPVGISFFTFQTISYTVDVYRRKVQPVRNIVDFGFYVAFFPQLVAGPIVRASEFIPQLYAKYLLTKREFGHALFLIIKGLIKKMVISDYISVNFVDRVFGAPELYSGAENLLSVYGYGLQIYCDFSGYTDIAIGVALILGFRLPFNFNSPYKATGVADFWKRWHISLSRWLKDYLYISMGGNRRGAFRTGLNLLITMLLGGLWHGASWRFVLWGLLHGIGLIINKIWSNFFPAPLRKRKLVTFLQILLTFNFVSFTWIFFRAESNSDALLIIRNIFTGFDLSHIPLIWQSYTPVLMVLIVGYVFHFLPGRVKESARGLFVQSPVLLQLLMATMVAVLLFRIHTTGIQPFIYFRF
jgi:alginate O-acetyltransferase complex protein AlgI